MWIERNKKFAARSKGIKFNEKKFIGIDEIQEGESKLILVIVTVNFTFIIIIIFIKFHQFIYEFIIWNSKGNILEQSLLLTKGFTELGVELV